MVSILDIKNFVLGVLALLTILAIPVGMVTLCFTYPITALGITALAFLFVYMHTAGL